MPARVGLAESGMTMVVEEQEPEAFFTAPAHARTRRFLEHVH